MRRTGSSQVGSGSQDDLKNPSLAQGLQLEEGNRRRFSLLGSKLENEVDLVVNKLDLGKSFLSHT